VGQTASRSLFGAVVQAMDSAASGAPITFRAQRTDADPFIITVTEEGGGMASTERVAAALSVYVPERFCSAAIHTEGSVNFT
jgi:hypothetical protein